MRDIVFILVIIAVNIPFFVVAYFMSLEQKKADALYLKEYGKERHPKKKKKY